MIYNEFFCDCNNKERKYRPRPTQNGQNGTSSRNNIGNRSALVIREVSSLFCSLVLKVNKVTVLCSLGLEGTVLVSVLRPSALVLVGRPSHHHHHHIR